MRAAPTTFEVAGPVQAEVFAVWLARGSPDLTGPCGAAPWLIEVGADQRAMGRTPHAEEATREAGRSRG